jgi:cell division protease FtsH
MPYLVPHSPNARTLSFSEFVGQVDAEHLSEVEITPSELIGILKPKQGNKNARPEFIRATRLPGIEETSLLKDLESHHIKIVGKMQSSHPFLSLLVAWLPFLLLMGLMVYGTWRGRQAMGQLQLGKNRAKVYDQTAKTRVTFSDVAGIDESQAELEEVVDFLKHPNKYRLWVIKNASERVSCWFRPAVTMVKTA